MRSLLDDGYLSLFGLSNKLELGHLEYILAIEDEVELIKVKAEQEVKLRWIPGFQSGLGRLLEMNKVLRKDRSGSAMLPRDLKDYLQDTLRMIPQTRTISQLDDDKDEEEDYNEMIQEEDEEQRGMDINQEEDQPKQRDGMVEEAIRDEIKILQGHWYEVERGIGQGSWWCSLIELSSGRYQRPNQSLVPSIKGMDMAKDNGFEDTLRMEVMEEAH
ncbi:hypothetical protein BY996DRAFT_6439252 [Phakopsora pachyrhizi]|nr:hypothetical protein BY996DRAFT_6439252 [Phakopsora pachyrhizi]